MKLAEVHIGGWYTKDGLFARQVLSIGDQVHYRDFSMNSGEPMSTSSLCGLSSFATWSRRTLTPEEIACMRTDEADRRVIERQEAMSRVLQMAMDLSVDSHLYAASDAALLAEVRRRGLVTDALRPRAPAEGEAAPARSRKSKRNRSDAQDVK